MQSVGTLQSYLQLNQLSHYSTARIGWITGMYMFLSYFFNIQVGPICDHYGPMVVGPVGVVITVASFLILAECSTYWQMMLCLGLLGSLGGAIIATVAVSVVAKLFSRLQGLAMGIAITGSSVGAILFPIMLRSTLARFGWKWAMRTLAFTVAGIIIPGVFCFIPFQRLASSLPHHEPQTQGVKPLSTSPPHARTLSPSLLASLSSWSSPSLASPVSYRQSQSTQASAPKMDTHCSLSSVSALVSVEFFLVSLATWLGLSTRS